MTVGLKVREGKTELEIPDGTVFYYPYVDINGYAKVMHPIDVAGLKRSTFRDIVRLVYASWQTPNKGYSKEVISSMGGLNEVPLISDTAVLSILERGDYIQDHPDLDKNGLPKMNPITLDEKLESEDPSVRFVRYGYYKHGGMSSEEFAENAFIRALVNDRETANMLAEIADKYSEKPQLLHYPVRADCLPEISIPTLTVHWWRTDRIRKCLEINGSNKDVAWGRTFGIIKQVA